MQEIDYKKLKFKSGLEIHQQLDSAKKLFCNCPAVLRKDEPDYEVKRKLHAVAGESGEVDVAASHEAAQNKEFVYKGYDSTCLVELDEEPPREINKEALKIAVQIGLLFNMKIIPITQIMRKTVVNGSNTGGFQRTLLIARDGSVETKSGKVGIKFLYLEEDAARIVSRGKNKDVYKLDRLGVPLVEVVTDPDIKNAEHAKEVALAIGNVLRSCKVKRGIGTIRQDVNISIREENRVEIKGMQDMDIFVNAIENEVIRQKELSDEGKPVEMEVRNVLPDATTEFMRPLPGSARMYPETDLPLLKISRDFINDAKKDLPKLKTDVESELRGKGLGEEMIKLLFKQNKLELFEELLKIVNKTELIAKMILMWPKEIAKHANKDLAEVENLLEDNFGSVLVELDKGKILESDVKNVLGDLVEGKSLEEATKIEKADSGNVEEFVMKIVKEKPGLNANAYMGLVMKEFKGAVNGGDVMTILKKYIS
jgi:Glu-tRNA(Gln) amidotransferase subunit E-like FAD-binding protein